MPQDFIFCGNASSLFYCNCTGRLTQLARCCAVPLRNPLCAELWTRWICSYSLTSPLWACVCIEVFFFSSAEGFLFVPLALELIILASAGANSIRVATVMAFSTERWDDRSKHPSYVRHVCFRETLLCNELICHSPKGMGHNRISWSSGALFCWFLFKLTESSAIVCVLRAINSLLTDHTLTNEWLPECVIVNRLPQVLQTDSRDFLDWVDLFHAGYSSFSAALHFLQHYCLSPVTLVL